MVLLLLLLLLLLSPALCSLRALPQSVVYAPSERCRPTRDSQ